MLLLIKLKLDKHLRTCVTRFVLPFGTLIKTYHHCLFFLLFIEAQGTSAKRKVDIRIFDKSYKATEEEIERKLAQAVLTERGYKKATQLTQSTDDESGTPLQAKKIVRYRKIVPCEDIPEVEEELRKRVPGVWGRDVSMKVRQEAIKKRAKNAQCDAGIEIHYPSKSCPGQLSKTIKRTIPGCTIGDCMFCFFLTVQ